MRRENLRTDITKQVFAWFTRRVRIDERLLQVLEYAPGCGEGWMDSADVFSATLKHLPSLTDLFIRAGVPARIMADAAAELYSELDLDAQSDLFGLYPLDLAINQTLELAFPEESTAFQRIQRKGSLSAIDLITAELEAEIDSKEIGSELTASVLRSAKFGATYWDSENNKYVTDLARRIRFLDKRLSQN